MDAEVAAPGHRWQMAAGPRNNAFVSADELPSGPLILPLSQWLTRNAQTSAACVGVWLGPDDEVVSLIPWFPRLPWISRDFATVALTASPAIGYLISESTYTRQRNV